MLGGAILGAIRVEFPIPRPYDPERLGWHHIGAPGEGGTILGAYWVRLAAGGISTFKSESKQSVLELFDDTTHAARGGDERV